MVQDAKSVALNINDHIAHARWRDSNRQVGFSINLCNIFTSI